MTDFLVNPRRAPRAPSRCRATVQIPGSAWDSETEDIGPHGCQLVAPKPLPRGLAVQVAVASPHVPGPLQVGGKIAWVSSQPPWRLGVAFAEGSRAVATRWYGSLIAASPGLGNFRRVPERLPLDAMVFLGPPPRFMVDFTAEEVEVLRHVAGGITVAALRDRLRATWDGSVRAFFGLMARQAITVSRGAAAHPEAWKQVMAGFGATFVVEPPAAASRPPPPVFEGSARAEQATMRAVELGRGAEREATAAAPPPAVPSVPPPLPPAATSIPPAPPPPVVPQDAPPGAATAGTGWRGAGRSRTREAQESLDLGRQELAAGRVSSALAHLRRALTLAPGDAEVAAELGKAMRGGA